MKINVQGGTNAGRRKPYREGHGPRCVCRKCKPKEKR